MTYSADRIEALVTMLPAAARTMWCDKTTFRILPKKVFDAFVAEGRITTCNMTDYCKGRMVPVVRYKLVR